MKNLRKLNPLVYWVIMSVYITLKTILKIVIELAELILGILAICLGIVIGLVCPPLGILMGVLILTRKKT